jgi:uncharacterized coiled-coil DUF342 family protein
MEATLNHDTTLNTATCQRSTALSGSLSNEIASLKSANSSLADTVEMLCGDNTQVCEELTEALHAFSEAMTNTECIHTKKNEAAEQANVTICKLYNRISGLNEQINKLEHSHSPERKQLHCYTQSPTIPNYCHTSSHLSN